SRYLRRQTGQLAAAAAEGTWHGESGGGDGEHTAQTRPTTPQDIPRRTSRASTSRLLRLEPRRRLSLPQTMSLGRRLASAVAELHRRGLVHRDLKPSNIFLPGATIEHLKIVDLGAVWRGAGDSLRERDVLV